jgi:hypothetical protein
VFGKPEEVLILEGPFQNEDGVILRQGADSVNLIRADRLEAKELGGPDRVDVF